MRSIFLSVVALLLIFLIKACVALDAVWAAANTSIRISIVHFYITIFRSNRIFLKIAYAVMIFVSTFGVAIFVSDILTCRPLSKEWNPLQPGVCESPFVSLIAQSSCNIATDFIVILLPMPMIWGLQIATPRKIELTIIFALGFMYALQATSSVFSSANIYMHSVCVVTIIRLILSTLIRLDDFTYSIARISIPTILEPLLGIIIACLPISPPAFKALTGRIKKTLQIRNVLSSSMARMRFKRSESSTLQNSDDSSPLTDLEAKGTQNHITGPSGKYDYLFEGYGQYAGVRMPPQSSIMIEQALEVRSDEAK